jgi:hypothetical protein
MFKYPVFNRNHGASESDNGIRMPSQLLDARAASMCIGEVLGRLETFTKSREEIQRSMPWAVRFVMGFPIPSWQRPLVWTNEQNIRFIRSIWLGLDIGSYMINDVYEIINVDNQNQVREFSEILLDGQQRLNSIQGYVLNEYPVPDKDGIPRYWSDLSRTERRRFSAFHFSQSSIRSWNEDDLRFAYDLRAFGGTPHEEHQRAIPLSKLEITG